MFLSSAQLGIKGNFVRSFQTLGASMAIVSYGHDGDIYVAVDGSGVIESLDELTGGYEYTDLKGNPLEFDKARAFIDRLER